MDVKLSHLSISELLSLYLGILKELRLRNITRSSNSPLGDYAEYLFCESFQWKRYNNSKKGMDAVDAEGRRYQIKGRRPTPENKSKQMGIIRNLEEQEFDFLAAVLFDEEFKVSLAAIIPYQVIQSTSKYSKHSNGYIFHFKTEILKEDGVIDVTQHLDNTSKSLNT